MATTDARGHTVPEATDHPTRQGWVLDPLMTVRDATPVANTTERAQLIVDLAAHSPSIVPSTTEPVFVWRANAVAWHKLEVTEDGTTWRPVYPTPVTTVVTSGSSSTSGTTELVLASSGAVTYDGNTKVRFSFAWYNVVQTVATDFFLIKFYDGPTAGSGTLLAQALLQPALNSGSGTFWIDNTPSAGSHTFTARLVRSSGSGTAALSAASTAPATLSVGPI
jgi:hypothetical protein